MTITVHSYGKWVVLSREGADDLRHEVPRKNKFFKEELRLLREEIVAWSCGKACDHLVVYKPRNMSFYRGAIYHAVLIATRQKGNLALITTYEESTHVTR